MSGSRTSPRGDDGEDGFLSRWSRLKRESDTEDVRDPSEDAPPPSQDVQSPEDAELSDAELLEKHHLPDPDGLKAGDDFSAFMKSGVPARLRNRALRKLWLTDPTLANLDELVDYGEDFTDAATVVENLQTLYQVGRGFLRDEDFDKGSDEEAEPDEAAVGKQSPHPSPLPEGEGTPSRMVDASSPGSAGSVVEMTGGAGPHPSPLPEGEGTPLRQLDASLSGGADSVEEMTGGAGPHPSPLPEGEGTPLRQVDASSSDSAGSVVEMKGEAGPHPSRLPGGEGMPSRQAEALPRNPEPSAQDKPSRRRMAFVFDEPAS